MTTLRSPDHRARRSPVPHELFDAGRKVGWIAGDTVSFQGFDSEIEAAHAAWVAHRTLARRIAREEGTRPLPIDTEPLAIQRRGDVELILAGGNAIATLRRPDTDGADDVERFAFEIRVPPPADEFRVGALAHLMYRTLRKSGLRWGLWRTVPERALALPQAVSEPVQSARGEAGDTDRGNRWWRSRMLPGSPWRRARPRTPALERTPRLLAAR